MDYQGLSINHFEHDTFQLKKGDLVVYLDPFKLTDRQIEPADFIFITHHHFDHCSPEDIKKIIAGKTVILAGGLSEEQLKDLKVKEVKFVKPREHFEFENLKVETVPAYNLDKWRSKGVPYHPREENHVGFVVEIDGIRIYHPGDSDNIPEMAELKNIDVALIPVSGTYVMTPLEAISACGIIKPKLAIPMHYGSIVGNQSDAQEFKEGANCQVELI
ncbi:MAG TPA: MBL fold metallo-hydrolase [Patescibacteria group bacterium]|nr:MBL fold metallo-hydrolase [Patescibacteria group bacterium]